MQAALERLDSHNTAVDEQLVLASKCGTVQLSTGRRCLLPARHRGACEMSAPSRPTSGHRPYDSCVAR